MAIGELPRENRSLRQQLRSALEQGDRLAEENEQLQQRLSKLEQEAARQAAPFRAIAP